MIACIAENWPANRIGAKMRPTAFAWALFSTRQIRAFLEILMLEASGCGQPFGVELKGLAEEIDIIKTSFSIFSSA